MKIKKAVQLWKDFDFRVAFANFCASAFSHPRAVMLLRDEALVNYLRRNYGEVIQKYKNLPENNSHETSGIIWSVWWQGEENAPEIVKKCFANIRKYCGTHEFKVITKENYRDYIDIPEYISKKVNDGIITFTHFSDILRMGLLYKYGGLWLDATILVTDEIPEEIFEAPYFTVRCVYDIYFSYPSRKRWTGFIQAAQKENKLCGFAYELMLEYWKTHKSLFDYFLIDYAIALAYENFPEIRNIIDSVPFSNSEVENLQPLLGEPFDEKKFEELTSSTMFFKLTWKRKFEKNISGVPTFYGKILESDF